MGNFSALPGYPYGANAPFDHAAANQLSEQGQATINATGGSAHAPTGDIALSGANGGGLSFDTGDPLPFFGSLDVTSNLLCTAPVGGSVTFDKLVAVDVRGPMTFKAAPGGAPGTAQFEAGASCTFASSATLTCASGSTANLTGAVNVRGTMTVKSTANGGPGHIVLEDDTDLTLAAGSELDCIAPAFFTGGVAIDSNIVLGAGRTVSGGGITWTAPITFGSGVAPALDPARTWHRRARLRAVTYDAGVAQAIETISPLFAAPSIYSLNGSGSAVYLYLEFDPPHAGKITAVEVRSVIGTNPLGAFTLGTYELVRWDHGLDANATSLSDVVNDGHAAGGGDWNTVLTTSLTNISNSVVDRTHGYGVRVTAPVVGGNGLACWYDVLVTGTIAELNGQ